MVPEAIGKEKMQGGDKKTHLTKFSSSLLFALIGGVVGSSAFFPPIESAAPVNVVASVAIASYSYLVSPIFLIYPSILPYPFPEKPECREQLLRLQHRKHQCLQLIVLRRLSFAAEEAPLGIEKTGHTTCDPTWRPKIVYIATIFAVVKAV